MASTDLTLARLREVLDYNPDTGVFIWRKPASRRMKPGDVAGTPHNKGYIMLNVDGRRYYAHRLAWFYVHGVWPAADIDHKHGQKSDNRISELREATRSQNLENLRGPRSHNKSGLLGVFAEKRAGVPTGKFVAVIVVKKKRLWLGAFQTPEMAHAAYLEAKREHHLGP